jgi:hypothetical protein
MERSVDWIVGSRKSRRAKASFQDLFSHLIIPYRFRSEAKEPKNQRNDILVKFVLKL